MRFILPGMRRILCSIALCVLGCSEKAEKLSCEDADYTVCGTPLPGLQSDGQPWPTFSEAVAEERLCRDGGEWPEFLVGMCADGKHFIAKNGGFGGQTRFFEGETLVGLGAFSDVGGFCLCPFEYFSGTLATVRCDAPVFEALCDTVAPAEFHPPFSQGTSAQCQCDDPS